MVVSVARLNVTVEPTGQEAEVGTEMRRWPVSGESMVR